ncbi:hypothetical protein ALO83_200027 [Pseudomonas cannabina pv. alisalensis]|nr:hypothetical protein ALO83_200027 [Pseudomonas cannabina pv. alisalensis]
MVIKNRPFRGRLRKRILQYVKLISVVVMAGIFHHGVWGVTEQKNNLNPATRARYGSKGWFFPRWLYRVAVIPIEP